MRRWLFAVLLAGCGSDARHYDPPPPEAVASCQLVDQDGSRVYRNALWLDAASRVIQVDGYSNESTRLEYDDQNRVVRTTTPSSMTTFTYEPTRVTSVSTEGETYVYDLGPDGRVMHYEGPEEDAPAKRATGDYQYDSGGNITSVSGASRFTVSESGNVFARPYGYHYTYDDRGRVTSSSSDEFPTTTTYAYTETTTQISIAIGNGNQQWGTWTYDLDDAGRVVHALVVGDGEDLKRGYAYAYDGDAITATPTQVPPGYSTTDVMTATGMCPAVATTFGPDSRLPFDLVHTHIWLPNPPADAFAGFPL